MFLVWIQDERIPCWHCLRVSRSAVSRDVLGATIQHATAPQILKQLASNGTAGCCDCEGDSSHQTQRAKGLDVCLCTSPRWKLHCVILVAQHYWPAAAEEFQLTSIVCVCAGVSLWPNAAVYHITSGGKSFKANSTKQKKRRRDF